MTFTLFNTFNLINWSIIFFLIILFMDSIPFYMGIHYKSNESVVFDWSYKLSFIYYSFMFNLVSLGLANYWLAYLDLTFTASFMFWLTVYACKSMKFATLLYKLSGQSKDKLSIFTMETVLHVLSFMSQPLSLFIRIFSNTWVAHIIMSLISCNLYLYFFNHFELGVICVQTFVYIYLLTIYKSKL